MRNSYKALIGSAVIFSSVFTAAPVFAESSKFSAATSDHVLLQGTDQDYTTVLSAAIRTPNQKDLFVQTSMECGLYTRTLVSSLGGETDSSVSEAVVRARVILDPGTANETLAFPGEITLCAREQKMSATFAGQCSDDDGDGTVTADECDEEEVDLALRTLNANAFNFVLDDLPSGNHVIAVQAQIKSATAFEDGDADAFAIVGNGSVGVEEVRMVKSLEVQEDEAGSGDDSWNEFDEIIEMSF